MTLKDIAWQRLLNQRLIGKPFSRPTEAVKWLCAVQSQDYYGAKWALAQRSSNVSNTDLDKLYNEGKFLRTHVMRPTWHFVMPEDIRWMQMLTAHRVKALMVYYDRRLELDDKLYKRTASIIYKALNGGTHLTRAELAQVLQTAGITASGQRLGHIMIRAELDALICSGALKGKQFTYALVEERAPTAKELKHDEALAGLASRYFASHGPATTHDFAWWSGLTATEAKAGVEMIKSKLHSEIVDGKTYWFTALRKIPELKAPAIHLLPNFDEHLIAYKGYAATLNFDAGKKLKPGNDALINHLVVRERQVIGGWKRTLKSKEVIIQLKLLVKLNADEKAALKAAAGEYGKFLGLEAKIMGVS